MPTLLIQRIAKLFEQLKSRFKCTNNWNRYQSKVTTQAQNQHLDYLIDLTFQGVNRFFALPFPSDMA